MKNDVLFYMKPITKFLICLIILTNSFIDASRLSQSKSKPGKSPQRHLEGEDSNYIVVYYDGEVTYTKYKTQDILKLKVDDDKEIKDLSKLETENIKITKNLKIYFSSEKTSLEGFFSSSSGDSSDENANKITSIDFSNFVSSKVTRMNNLFNGCESLKSVNFQNFNAESVTDMSSMFSGCTKLESLNLSSFKTSALTQVPNMFNGCSGLKLLDISNFDLSNVKTKDAEEKELTANYVDMFKDVSLKYINLEKVIDPNGIIKTALALTEDQELTVCQSKDKKILEGDKIIDKCCDFNVTEGKCPEQPANDTNTTNITNSVQLSTTINTESATNIATTQNANLPSNTVTATVVETSKPTEIVTTIPNEPSGSLPKFIIESINQNNCDTTGKLIFQGRLTQSFSRTIKLTLNLQNPSGISLICTLNGNELSCETDRVISNIISIAETNITEYDKDILIIGSFTSSETIKCANAYIQKAESKLSVNIAFRQVSHFQKNDQSSSFSFYLITLISESLNKGYSLNLKMEMKINEAKTEKNAVCILQDNIKPNSGELSQGNFVCTVQLTSSEYSSTNFESVSVSSDNAEINGVNDLDETLSSPMKTDAAIESIKKKKQNGEEITDLADIVDYYEEEIKPTPIFTISSVNMDKCNTNGKFIIQGTFSDDMTDSIKFDFYMTYPLSEINCEFNGAKKSDTIEMTCKVYTEFNSVEKILIEQKLIKKKNKEIFILQKFSLTQNIACESYIKAKIKKVEKRKSSNLSFLQLGKFTPRANFVSFFMVLASTTGQFDSTFPLTIKLTFANRRRLRNLETSLSGINTGCNLNQDLKTSKAAGYDCSNTDSFTGTPSAMELETDDIDNIQGIPPNANPAKMNNNVDLSNLDNLKNIDNLPFATIQSIDGQKCITEGQYTVKAKLDKNENLSGDYTNIVLRLSAPEASALCKMNINGVNVEMTCDNKDKFYQSKILIERQIIQDNEGKQLFFINYYDSESNEFECDISLNLWSTESPSNEPDTTDNTNNERRYIKKSSGGLSGGAIAGIVIACVVVLTTVAIIAYLAKKGVLSGRKDISTNSNNNSTIINFRNN